MRVTAHFYFTVMKREPQSKETTASENSAEICESADTLEQTGLVLSDETEFNVADGETAEGADETEVGTQGGILCDYAQKKGKKSGALAVIKKLCKRYFIDAFTGMAQGLFCTLIAGTIIAQIASWCGDNTFAITLNYIASIAKMLMGAAIGVGIAHKLGAKPLVMFTAAATGMIGAWAGGLVQALVAGAPFAIGLGAPGNPIGAYVVSLITIEIAGFYAGKTKLDIVLVPLGMLVLCLVGIFAAYPFILLIDLFAKGIVLAIEAGAAVKIIVGIFVAIVMGILLTMPTSSAAIWIAIATSATAVANPEAFGIAGGAAVAGCSAHMIGFAVATFRENRWSGLISQGIGTSMLQIPNIMKKPLIMLPEIVASAVSGLVAVLIGIRCNAAGGGMGTSGLVGVFGTVDASMAAGVATWRIAVGIILCLFVIPAAVSLFVSEVLRTRKLIKPEDMKLEA